MRQKLAGIFTVMLICGGTIAAAWAIITLAGMSHFAALDAAAIVLIYWSIAARDLAGHALAVRGPLSAGKLTLARQKVALIVGRDTESLDEPGIVRATVESVAESAVDGVTAPLLFAAAAGPIGAITYRAINTLDSMFGHKDSRYLHFGWAAARLDDLANFIPARLTGLLMPLAAALIGQNGIRSLKTMLSDRHKHDSPNSGIPEAAMAGALGVQLGGLNFYAGEPLDKPIIGRAIRPLAPACITRAVALMFATEAVFLAAAIGMRILAITLWHDWRSA